MAHGLLRIVAAEKSHASVRTEGGTAEFVGFHRSEDRRRLQCLANSSQVSTIRGSVLIIRTLPNKAGAVSNRQVRQGRQEMLLLLVFSACLAVQATCKWSCTPVPGTSMSREAAKGTKAPWVLYFAAFTSSRDAWVAESASVTPESDALLRRRRGTEQKERNVFDFVSR
jgi:hypothetical protein